MVTMAEPAIKEQIVRDLDALSPRSLSAVADYVHETKEREDSVRSAAKAKLLEQFGAWRGEMGDHIAQVIEEGCEQIDPDGW